jgi:chloride channel protein, CIC family
MKPAFQYFLQRRYPVSNPVENPIGIGDGNSNINSDTATTTVTTTTTTTSATTTPVAKVTPQTLVLAVGVAILAVVIAQLSVWGINAISNLVFLGAFSVEEIDATNSGIDLGIIALPLVGVLIWVLVNKFTKGRLNSWLQPLCAVIGMGTGIPLGTEGVVIGASMALESTGSNKQAGISNNAQKQQKLVITSGFVAGIAYLFGSPFAAAVLAIELFGVASAPLNILALVLSAGIGGLSRYYFLGGAAVFAMHDVLPPSVSAVAGYAVTGIITGLLGVGYTALAKLVRKFVTGNDASANNAVSGKAIWLALAAGLITGICGYYAPEMLGPGWNNITNLINASVTLWILLALGVIKLIAWIIASGSKIPGGNILPLMILGGAAGLFTTFMLQVMFPAVHLDPGVAALVGMMAMLAAGLRILPAAILLGLEIARQGHVLLPLIAAVVLAYGVAFLFGRPRKVANNG